MSRFSKTHAMGMALLAAAVVAAGCGSDAGGADSPTSTRPDPVTTVAATTTVQPVTASTIETETGVTVVVGEPYRRPGDDDPSTVDIYMADGEPGQPAIVLLHGWGPGGRDGPDLDMGPLAEEIAQLGATVFYFFWDTNGGYSGDSAADLSCIGGFLSARAAEYGADPNTVVVVGHSMGGEAGSMLALSSFGLAPGGDCVETGDGPTPYAVLGIAGAYGVHAEPLDDELTMFAVRKQPADAIREIAATELVTTGLTALQAYELSGYSTLPSSNPLRAVLAVGSKDQYPVTDELVTAAFAEALTTHGTDVEVIVVPDANHNTIIDPDDPGGQQTLQIVADLLNNAP